MFAADPVVKKETKFIAVWVLILSCILQAVFLVIGKWDYTVLLGNLLSGTAAVVNFLLMGLTVVKTLEKQKEDDDGDFKEARQFAKMSQTARNAMIVIVGVLGPALPCFNIFSTLIPLFFPRIAAWIRMLFVKGSDAPAAGSSETEGSSESNAENVEAEETERGENE